METVDNFTILSQIETAPTSVPPSTVKRVAITTARYLVGFLMTLGGLSAFLDFAYHPLPTLLLATKYMEGLLNFPYMVRVVSLQVTAGVLLLVNRFVALALAILAAIQFNILLYLATLQAESYGDRVHRAPYKL